MSSPFYVYDFSCLSRAEIENPTNLLKSSKVDNVALCESFAKSNASVLKPQSSTAGISIYLRLDREMPIHGFPFSSYKSLLINGLDVEPKYVALMAGLLVKLVDVYGHLMPIVLRCKKQCAYDVSAALNTYLRRASRADCSVEVFGQCSGDETIRGSYLFGWESMHIIHLVEWDGIEAFRALHDV